MRRREQMIDKAFVRERRPVRHEGIHFRGGGEEPRDIERDATDEGGEVRRGRGSDPFLLQPGQDERIDGALAGDRKIGPADRLESPMGGLRPGGGSGLCIAGGPNRACIDSGLNACDFFLAEARPCGRHDTAVAAGGDHLHIPAGGGIAHNDYGA